jgi:hypothetical protein
MNKNEIVLKRIKNTRRNRWVIVTIGILVCVALTVAIVVNFIFVETSVIQRYNSERESLQTSVTNLSNQIADLETIMNATPKEQKTSIEYKEVGEVYAKSTELLTSTNKKMDQISRTSASDIPEIDELKKQIDDMVVRGKKMNDQLNTKVSASNYETSLKQLKDKMTEATKLVNESKIYLGENAVKTLQNEIDNAGNLLNNDFTDQEKQKASDQLKQQVADEINVLSEKMSALQEKYDKVKPKSNSSSNSSSGDRN